LRVLHVYSGNLYGGIESLFAAIARRGGGNEHEFALCFEGRLAAELAAAGATVHLLGAVSMRKPYSAAAARRVLASVVRGQTFDRVICHAPWTQGLFGGVIRRAGRPLVFWAHDVMTGRHWTERLARPVTPDLAICNSHFTGRSLAALYPGLTPIIVYAPVEMAAAGATGRSAVRALPSARSQERAGRAYRLIAPDQFDNVAARVDVAERERTRFVGEVRRQEPAVARIAQPGRSSAAADRWRRSTR